MTTKQFWELIANSKQQGPEQGEWLTQQLAKLESEEIIEYELEFMGKMEQSYTSSLWGAAYVIMGGCSDDGFDYFRSWLISRGEEIFQQAVNNPEFLAEYLSEDNLQEDEFAPQFEDFLYIASAAYTYLKTGSYDFNDDVATEFSDEVKARGHEAKPDEMVLDWEEEDLESRYPLLWNKLWENPLT